MKGIRVEMTGNMKKGYIEGLAAVGVIKIVPSEEETPSEEPLE